MEISVHVRVCHAPEELWVVLTEGFSIIRRIFLKRWWVGFEDTLFGPLSLVLLLDSDEGISFLCLRVGNLLSWKNRE